MRFLDYYSASHHYHRTCNRLAEVNILFYNENDVTEIYRKGTNFLKKIKMNPEKYSLKVDVTLQLLQAHFYKHPALDRDPREIPEGVLSDFFLLFHHGLYPSALADLEKKILL